MVDNTSRVHGMVRPFVAVLKVGGCGLLLLRRPQGQKSRLEEAFCVVPDQTAPEQPRLATDISLCALEEKSEVQCVSTCEGDVVVLGSNSVFEALQPSGIAQVCNEILGKRPGLLRSPGFMPGEADLPELSDATAVLRELAQSIVLATHARGQPVGCLRRTPDDASVVVAEVVPWHRAKVASASTTTGSAQGGG